MRHYLLIMLCFVAVTSVRSAHIVGGDMTYTCLGTVNGKTRIEVTMTMYRDSKSGGAQFDNVARFGVFEQEPNGFWTLRETIDNIPVTEIQAITNTGSNPCLVIPPDVGVQKGVYKFQVELDPTDTEYFIAYQRCCRNGTINNITDPGNTGSVISVRVSSFSVDNCNNSPTFNDFPPIVICNGEDVDFDHSASDIEGDFITYSFCAPLASGGTDGSGGPGTGDPNSCTGVTPSPTNCPPNYQPVQFALPTYSTANPMGGSPQITIDANTGLISGVPQVTGQFVVGICATEYRNGVVIGEIRRDFQFNVTNCDDAVFAAMDADEVLADGTYVINSCGDNTIDLVNRSGISNFIDEYYWEFDILGQPQSFNTRDAQLVLPQPGTYTGFLHLNNNVPSEKCRDTANIVINYYPAIIANFDYSYDTCFAEPVQFVDQSVSGSGVITERLWSFDDDSTSVEQDPLHPYMIPGQFNVSLVVTDVNNCTDEIVQTIDYFPVPGLIVIEPTQFIGCSPAPIFFNNLSTPIDSTYTITWDFGDGGSSSDISPTHTFTDPGFYSINVDLVSPIGCETSANFNNWIEIKPGPIADFTCEPEELNSFDSTVEVMDASTDAVDWFYTFGDGGISYISEPSHTYRDTGMYTIMQVVKHQSGCTDTMFKQVDVLPVVSYHMPNAFTPNNDGLNDDFRGKGVLPGVSDFSMKIWNRWGEMVYETDEPSRGWNGEYHNKGSLLPGGVYVYTVHYTEPRGKKVELKGHVTLIR